MTEMYDASHITVLEGLTPVRERPAMYIGSTDTRGLHLGKSRFCPPDCQRQPRQPDRDHVLHGQLFFMHNSCLTKGEDR